MTRAKQHAFPYFFTCPYEYEQVNKTTLNSGPSLKFPRSKILFDGVLEESDASAFYVDETEIGDSSADERLDGIMAGIEESNRVLMQEVKDAVKGLLEQIPKEEL